MSVSADVREFAESAYNGYLAYSGGKSISTGAKLPQFEEQPEKIKAAWTNAAVAAINAYQDATAAPALPDDATKRIAESLVRMLKRDPQCALARAIREAMA